MRVLFVGEPDNGYNCTAHNAQALSTVGVQALFDTGAGWRSAEWRQLCRQADVVHVVTYAQQNWMLLRKLWRARMMGLPVVRYWVGSDCLWARFHEPSRRFAQALAHLEVVNLAVADHLVEELARIHVEARYTPIVTPHICSGAQPQRLPSRVTALCYLPSHKREFYGAGIIDALIRDLPGVQFIVLCDQATDYSAFANVESPGHVEDLARTIGRCTVLVRPTMHDGMPRLMLEMLSRGRHAVCSQPYPHCLQADSLAEYKQALRTLADGAEFNLEGREYVCRNFETRHTVKLLQSHLLERLQPGRAALSKTGKVQAGRLLARFPALLSRKHLPLPHSSELPPEADALRWHLKAAEKAEPCRIGAGDA